MIITETIHTLQPQASPVEAAITSLAQRLLASPLIPKEQHEAVRAWQKTVLDNLLDKRRAPRAVIDICRVVWPLLKTHPELISFQDEVEKILRDLFGMKDPEKLINTYRKAWRLATKDAIITALFLQIEVLITQYAQATDDARVGLFEKLQAQLLKLNSSRDKMSKEAHARTDVINARVKVVLQKGQDSGDHSEDICRQLGGIRLTSNSNAAQAEAFAERLKK